MGPEPEPRRAYWFGQESDKAAAKDAGFDHHFVKPADIGKVQELLATLQPEHE